MKYYACSALCFLMLLGGCTESSPKPDGLIAEDKYVNLMVELQLVRTYGENAEVDTASVDSLKNEVLRSYGESLETFRTSHQYYQQFPQEQKKRIEKAIELLKMDRVAEEDSTDTRPRRH